MQDQTEYAMGVSDLAEAGSIEATSKGWAAWQDVGFDWQKDYTPQELTGFRKKIARQLERLVQEQPLPQSFYAPGIRSEFREQMLRSDFREMVYHCTVFCDMAHEQVEKYDRRTRQNAFSDFLSLPTRVDDARQIRIQKAQDIAETVNVVITLAVGAVGLFAGAIGAGHAAEYFELSKWLTYAACVPGAAAGAAIAGAAGYFVSFLPMRLLEEQKEKQAKQDEQEFISQLRRFAEKNP